MFDLTSAEEMSLDDLIKQVMDNHKCKDKEAVKVLIEALSDMLDWEEPSK